MGECVGKSNVGRKKGQEGLHRDHVCCCVDFGDLTERGAVMGFSNVEANGEMILMMRNQEFDEDSSTLLIPR